MCDPVLGAIALSTAATVYTANQSRNAMEDANDRQAAAQDEAERQRRLDALENRYEELRRQNAVRRGTTQIDNMFSSYGLDPLAPEGGYDLINLPDSFDRDAPWAEGLLENGGDFESMFGVSSTADLRDRQANSGFFDERRHSYLDYATPQLERKLENQRDELAFALTRAGLNRSSSAASRGQELGEQANMARNQIASTAQDIANQARGSILDVRSNLVDQLRATGDPQAALAGVGDRLQTIEQTPAYTPLGQVFAGITQGIGGYQQGRRRGASGVPLSGFLNYGSTSGAGSSRVVGGG